MGRCTATTARARSPAPPAYDAAPELRRGRRGATGGLTIAATSTTGPDAVAFELERLEVVGAQVQVHGRWYGVRGHRFVRPALILTGDRGAERRLLADLDDKPWAAEDGQRWRAMFPLDSEEELARSQRLELSVAPDINVELRRGGVDAEGPIAATARVSEEPDLPFPIPPPRRRIRGVPPEPQPTSAEPAAEGPPTAPVAPRPRPPANRAADVERLTTRVRAAEATLEREQAHREELEQTLERERGQARHTIAELARVQAELELARTAEREAADTAAQLDAARRENHELRGHHEALRADHQRTLRTQAELEDKLAARTTELQTRTTELEAARRDTAAHHPPSPPRADRPIDPSLQRSPWLRLLVVIVIAAVLFALYLVLHSTVLH